jgi:hypothetical protein
MIGTVGAMVSFQEGSELLQELAGVELWDPEPSAKTSTLQHREILSS